MTAIETSHTVPRRLLSRGAVLLVLAAAPLYAQSTSSPARANVVHVELLGNGGLYSVNYGAGPLSSKAIHP